MIQQSITQRPFRGEPSLHAYKVGQAVLLKDGIGRPISPNVVYEITGILPPSNGSPQYKIRSEAERHERVAPENGLKPVEPTANRAAASLMERTFNHG